MRHQSNSFKPELLILNIFKKKILDIKVIPRTTRAMLVVKNNNKTTSLMTPMLGMWHTPKIRVRVVAGQNQGWSIKILLYTPDLAIYIKGLSLKIKSPIPHNPTENFWFAPKRILTVTPCIFLFAAIHKNYIFKIKYLLKNIKRFVKESYFSSKLR